MNHNHTAPTNFKLTLPDKTLKVVEFNVISCNLPGISSTPVKASVKNNYGYLAGDTIQFNAFNCKVMLDEDLENYLTLRDWMVHNKDSDVLKKIDGVLSTTTNLKNVNKQFKFVSLFPSVLTDIDFKTDVNEDEILFFDVTFSYDYWDRL